MKSEIKIEYLQNLRKIIEDFKENNENIKIYKAPQNISEYLINIGIDVKLDTYKEIILEEETQIELGGINKYSTSVIFPLSNKNNIQNGQITLIGPEIQEIRENNIDFGQIIIIGGKKISESHYNDFQRLQFISDGIQGFVIRSIPRRFWCRISKDAIKKGFSFNLLGNSIIYLFKKQFPELIEAIEIIFISASELNIKKFEEVISKIREIYKRNWAKKIEEWKERVDCNYDWVCDVCPYNETCYNISDIYELRKNIEFD